MLMCRKPHCAKHVPFKKKRNEWPVPHIPLEINWRNTTFESDWAWGACWKDRKTHVDKISDAGWVCTNWAEPFHAAFFEGWKGTVPIRAYYTGNVKLCALLMKKTSVCISCFMNVALPKLSQRADWQEERWMYKTTKMHLRHPYALLVLHHCFAFFEHCLYQFQKRLQSQLSIAQLGQSIGWFVGRCQNRK